jgi:hypothetical protein
MAEQKQPLTVDPGIEKLLKMYAEDSAQHKFNAIVLGQLGVGKTTLLKTARMPVLIDSFDPGGPKLRDFKPLIEAGRIVPDMRWSKSKEFPFSEWEKEFNNRVREKFFDKFGTYCIDSASTFLRSMAEYAMKKSGRDNVSQPEWGAIGNAFISHMKQCCALSCDFILTGHLTLEPEEVEGKMIARFASIPSMQINIPILFDEIYVLINEEKSDGIHVKLLTRPTGKYIARTRIGSGIFLPQEEPNIKKLLEKAGLPAEDRS